MSHVYKVEVNEAHRVYVEADNQGEARRTALAHVTIKRLSGSETVDLCRRGIAIVSAKTGKVCNASENVGAAAGTGEASQA